MKGFWISSISALGVGKKTAQVKLSKGANIITGPSDTGKSYLFSVINYTLGRTSVPDTDIPEGRGYDTFRLVVVSFETGEKFTLERVLNKSKVTVTSESGEVETYSSSSTLASGSNISSFLLKLCGLEKSFVLKNRTKGDKQLLSFKNLNQFTSIAEDRVITKDSPFYFTQNNSNHILEQSIISLILEGMDFANVKSIDDPRKKEIRISGQLEFIDKQIVNYSERIQKLEPLVRSTDQLNELSQSALMRELEIKAEKAKKLETRISDIYQEAHSLSEKKIYNQELLKRFEILKRQYLSDLERLDFISEAESLSSQLPGHLCPICSNPFNEGELAHEEELVKFRLSVKAEIEHTKVKLKDLGESIIDSMDKVSETLILLDDNNKSLINLESDLKSIKPQIVDLQSSLDKLLKQERFRNQLQFYEDEIQELYSKKDKLEQLRAEKESTDILNVCDYEVLKTLSKFIEVRLENWDYNENPKVVFDSNFKKFDIVISNKGRGSYGKGRRAISYTACLLGFLDFCLAENKKFSNLIIVDSPLTTFKDKEPDEEEFESIDDQFFDDLSKTSDEAQVIIFENKIPLSREGLNIIEFTRNSSIGRYGFYPLNN